MHGFCFASCSLICPIACAMEEEVSQLVHLNSTECVWCVLCVLCVIFHLPKTRHMGAALSRGWVAGRLWKPTPALAGWLAGWLAETAKIRSAPLYRLFSRMVWVWGWVCKGGGVGHLSRTPLPHTLRCLAFGTSHKDHIESPH